MDNELELMSSEMRKFGYSRQKITNTKSVEELRNALALWLRQIYNIKGDDCTVLNKIHKLGALKCDADANQLTLKSINYLSTDYKFDEIVHSACKDKLEYLIGQDIHSQKNNNLVVQHPGSKRIAELHIDSPPTSRYEVVAWVPLVNCYGTKSFYIIPKQASRDLLRDYRKGKYSTWDEFKEECKKSMEWIEMEYGNVLFFSSCLLHGSETNHTNETRWCMNVRFKSLFAPIGMHNALAYYRVLKLGPLTSLANEFND